MTAATWRPLPHPVPSPSIQPRRNRICAESDFAVLGSGCIDAHLVVLFGTVADRLPAGADPVAGGEVAVVGFAGEDDALDLGVRQEALGDDALGQ